MFKRERTGLALMITGTLALTFLVIFVFLAANNVSAESAGIALNLIPAGLINPGGKRCLASPA